MEQTSLVGKIEWMDRIRARSVTHRQTQLGWIEEESEWIPSILPFFVERKLCCNLAGKVSSSIFCRQPRIRLLSVLDVH